jgi:acyl-CoA dehydrogenase
MSRILYQDPSVRYGEKLYGYAMDFRKIALVIDESPMQIKQYVDLEGVQFLLSDTESSAYDRTCYLEALSYGDPGVVLASPGPSLSGLMLRALGTETQIQQFYQDMQTQKMRTFFALTEPNKGSDANHIETRLIKNSDGYVLHGQKCFFGNGAVAETGIVLAKIGDGPLGMRAIWMTPDTLSAHGVQRKTLDMFALRGAQIAAISFDHVIIPDTCILGNNTSACKNGLLSVMTVFNQLRTGVGALALGQAQGVYDLAYQYYKDSSIYSAIFLNMNGALTLAREALHQAAHQCDQNPFDFYATSAAKVIATRTAEQVISHCIDIFSYEMLLENPWVMKSYSDVFCWEYMEGTSVIQKMQLKSRLVKIRSEK